MKEEKKKFTNARKISEQYKQLSKCYDILSVIDINDKENMINYQGGWKMYASVIEDAGIDINNIYTYIKELAIKRKSILEQRLSKLDNNNE